MYKSTFHIEKMDCPSEESMIRMQLEPIEGIKSLNFDIPKRILEVYHVGLNPEIEHGLKQLNLGACKTNQIEITVEEAPEAEGMQKKLLWTVLLINFGFFVIEIIAGLLSKSMGLVADSLDMLADAIVYGLSLWAVGSLVKRKKRVATLSGYLQMILAAIGFLEVLRRFLGHGQMPDFKTMIIVSSLALVANAISLLLLQRSKSNDAHIKASLIFTSNDVIINGGVIVAGLLVYLTQSKYPDLIIGGLVFLIVIRGAIRILKLGK